MRWMRFLVTLVFIVIAPTVGAQTMNNISLHCDNVFNTVYRDNLSVIKDFIPQPARGFRLNYQAVY